MFEDTGCDAVLVSRGTLGQPWIAEDIRRYLEGADPILRTIEDHRQALYEHFLFTKAYHSPRRVAVDMRRVGCWYLKKSAGTRQFRELISKGDNMENIEDLILHFPLDMNAMEQKEAHDEEMAG
jgi:tRNA-dihydrouridine synthase